MALSRQRGNSWDWRSALAGALITAFGLGLLVLLWRRPSPPPVVVHPPPSPQVPTPPATTAPQAMLVFVSGAVQAPGVYSLDPGVRVADALDAAGGLRDDANAVAVNQAAPLNDGDQVHVPTQAEEPAAPPAGVSGAPMEDEATEGVLGGPVNVNTATQAELETLPGIGPARAQDIIDNRPFATVDELDRIPGIGPATLEELRPLVRVE